MSPVIVYVDDEPLLARAFGLLLARRNLAVATFTDARAALAFIQANDVRAIVSDYRMPGMTGLELLDRIEKDVPFLLLTGDLEVERLARGRARVMGVLGKPFTPEDLFDRLRPHLEPPSLGA